MVFLIILLVVANVAAGVFSICYKKVSDEAFLGVWISSMTVIILSLFLIGHSIEAKQNKALMQAHLDNPTNYTYSQLADHNELVTKTKVWQGTIFSFYNDTDLQVIDIDNVSQKVIVDSNEK